MSEQPAPTVSDLENQLAMYRRSLAFYADDGHWSVSDPRRLACGNATWLDRGRLARDTLLAPVVGALEARTIAAEAERDDALRRCAEAGVPVAALTARAQHAEVQLADATQAAAEWESEWRRLLYWMRMVFGCNDPAFIEKVWTLTVASCNTAEERAATAVRGNRQLAGTLRRQSGALEQAHKGTSPRRLASALQLAASRNRMHRDGIQRRMAEEIMAGSRTGKRPPLSDMERQSKALAKADAATQKVEASNRRGKGRPRKTKEDITDEP